MAELAGGYGKQFRQLGLNPRTSHVPTLHLKCSATLPPLFYIFQTFFSETKYTVDYSVTQSVIVPVMAKYLRFLWQFQRLIIPLKGRDVNSIKIYMQITEVFDRCISVHF